MLIAFNKPFGVLCQFTPDQPGQRTLSEFGLPKEVYSIGRLDMDSEGLLLFTDEKQLIAQLADPDNKHPKTYHVQIEGLPTPAKLKELEDGSLVIRGHQCRPATASILDPQPDYLPRTPPVRVRLAIPDIWLAITLTEGKNRQVRRMTAAIGHPTLRLIRASVGEIQLGSIPVGEWLVCS